MDAFYTCFRGKQSCLNIFSFTWYFIILYHTIFSLSHKFAFSWKLFHRHNHSIWWIYRHLNSDYLKSYPKHTEAHRFPFNFCLSGTSIYRTHTVIYSLLCLINHTIFLSFRDITSFTPVLLQFLLHFFHSNFVLYIYLFWKEHSHNAGPI